ncbi:hypothetical protein NA57DRAFT_70438 [Rhizodiscina lignyota]|uniref:Methyltransferase domain-containing protein n=1 Tax=Rhizodiscina lignyota TaxID=1504668 RepID=A0A9P4ITX9_9PEZI|nr:hypothetical protein NA57DRAFT_70438 [Rhizodiscina lignyota]
MAEHSKAFFEKTDEGEVKKRQEAFTQFLVDAPTTAKLAEARKLLEVYSRVKSEEVLPHVIAIRNKAWKIDPFPCIGQFNFLDLSVSRSPFYPEVLERVKHGHKLLDLGCCLGCEIRAFVADGAPSENLYGSDINSHFLALGYDLFLDKSTLKSTFIAADLFASPSPLDSLNGQMNIVYAASVIHLFDRPGQKKVVQRITQLLVTEPDSICLGRQVGDNGT